LIVEKIGSVGRVKDWKNSKMVKDGAILVMKKIWSLFIYGNFRPGQSSGSAPAHLRCRQLGMLMQAAPL
jgi:hypothetical protein